MPLYQQFSRLKKVWLSVSITLVLGGTISALSSLIIAQLLGASVQTQLSIAPKSVTTPVAMALSALLTSLIMSWLVGLFMVG